MQDSEKLDVLEAAIESADLQSMIVCIVLDLEAPWELMNQLKKWMKALQTFLFKMLPELGPGIYEKMKNKLVNDWKSYTEPQLNESGQLVHARPVEHIKGTDSDGEEQAIEDLKL